VVNNHRAGKLERLGPDPRALAERHPGIISVSVTCYGSTGPWADPVLVPRGSSQSRWL